MRRRLFTICSGISLVLCVATLGFWIAAQFWQRTWIRHFTVRESPTVIRKVVERWGWDRSRLFFQRDTWEAEFEHVDDADFIFPRLLVDAEQMPTVTRRNPFIPRDGWVRGRGAMSTSPVNFMAASAALAILPTIWIGTRLYAWRIERDRERIGKCGACGYDMRATPGCCPECGSVPAAARHR
jgi:hypothetical protein